MAEAPFPNRAAAWEMGKGGPAQAALRGRIYTPRNLFYFVPQTGVPRFNGKYSVLCEERPPEACVLCEERPPEALEPCQESCDLCGVSLCEQRMSPCVGS